MLNISNNKRRSLLKSEIIINIDFPEENINQYRIYQDSVIVNIGEKINISSKRFNGTNINYYKLEIPEEYKVEGFQNEIVYESLIYNINSFKDINNKITEDKVSIDKFIGNNGTINKEDILSKNSLKSLFKISQTYWQNHNKKVI